ncbi:glycosyltransferase [Novosphingobium resinovorum]|uniref:glycosyltransferase n=1 Tax=Novosphingobium resinovorum TaxID=158500 RepID=UPI003D27FDD8
MAGALVMRRIKGRMGAVALGILAVLVSTRYLFWRTTQTIAFNTPLEFLFGGVLYLAELYAWVILLLGFLQTTWPLDRPVIEPEGEPDTWPTVDIYIPTYNESLEIVRNTVFAAMDLDYPVDRYRVFILDDGKRPEFRAFAKEAGCGYITRDNNLHAKAGNLNAAMKKTDGELIAIFDCDPRPHSRLPAADRGLVPAGPAPGADPDPAPHVFARSGPAQPRADDGRHAGRGRPLLRPGAGRQRLVERHLLLRFVRDHPPRGADGDQRFRGETVTEDAHTALKLQRTGWNTAYISARLSAGLATERLVLHVGQRIRWARGMTQILRIDNRCSAAASPGSSASATSTR